LREPQIIIPGLAERLPGSVIRHTVDVRVLEDFSQYVSLDDDPRMASPTTKNPE
jgi:hypothetical protein